MTWGGVCGPGTSREVRALADGHKVRPYGGGERGTGGLAVRGDGWEEWHAPQDGRSQCFAGLVGWMGVELLIL